MIAGETMSAMTNAVNAIQRCYPGAEIALQVKPRALLQFGHVGTITGIPTDSEPELKFLGELLVAHLSVETELDECYALDFHQVERDDGELGKTEVGEDVYLGKYQSSKDARLRLATRVRSFIDAHPLYRAAGFLAYVPPHTSQPKSSLAERLTRGLSPEIGKPLADLIRIDERDPQKDIDDDDRDSTVNLRAKNQRFSMRCDTRLEGRAVIVLDDLIGTGASMNEAGRALRASGASAVFGLAMTKTRKFARLS